MEIATHSQIDRSLCGTPLVVEQGRSEVELIASETMAADATGLVHGGFVFGLADYAAMLAVNHPNVVLGKAASRFLVPVQVGQSLLARAEVHKVTGRRYEVQVEVLQAQSTVFEGEFTCYVLEDHVLANE